MKRQKPGPVIAGEAPLSAAANFRSAAGRPHATKLEHNLTPTLVIGPEGAIEQANLAFARLVGHERRQLSRMWCSDLILAVVEDGLAVQTLMAYAEDTIELLHSDLWVVNAALAVEPLSMRFGPGLLATFQDRTDRSPRAAQVSQWRAT